MVKNSLIRLVMLLGMTCLCCLSRDVKAQSLSEFYILISDAKSALQAGQEETALTLMQVFQQDFQDLPVFESQAGQLVLASLDDLLADQKLESEELRSLSKVLLAFEEEQNPQDVAAALARFEERVLPAVERFEEQVTQLDDLETIKQEFLRLNAVWTRNEAVVRSQLSHYSRIETALSFLRAAMETPEWNRKQLLERLTDVKQAIADFLAGEDLANPSPISSLHQGIGLLETAQVAFSQGQLEEGQEAMRQFIMAWPSFEQSVSVRDAQLYQEVESHAPIIMARGAEKASQDQLANLISRLEEIDTEVSYGIWDSAVILLREGVEALLIVLGLVGASQAIGQRKALKWIYFGAGAGLLTSFFLALVLQTLFPVLVAGTSREVLEGLVGILAVIMMLFVGIWLHSKAKASAWESYLNQQMASAVSSGSFGSVFLLSFLAVFREGAETILFYAGMMPYVSWQDFLLGIFLALVFLAILALVFLKATHRLPVHSLFRFLGWMIYALAFKMLGVSLHTLQLTNLLPSHDIFWLPPIPWLGIFPAWETLVPQLLFLLVILGTAWLHQKSN